MKMIEFQLRSLWRFIMQLHQVHLGMLLKEENTFKKSFDMSKVMYIMENYIFVKFLPCRIDILLHAQLIFEMVNKMRPF